MQKCTAFFIFNFKNYLHATDFEQSLALKTILQKIMYFIVYQAKIKNKDGENVVCAPPIKTNYCILIGEWPKKAKELKQMENHHFYTQKQDQVYSRGFIHVEKVIIYLRIKDTPTRLMQQSSITWITCFMGTIIEMRKQLEDINATSFQRLQIPYCIGSPQV